MRTNLILILRACGITFAALLALGFFMSCSPLGLVTLIGIVAGGVTYIVSFNVLFLMFLRFGLKFHYIFRSLKQIVTEIILMLTLMIVLPCMDSHGFITRHLAIFVSGGLAIIYVIIRIAALYHPQIVKWGNNENWHEDDSNKATLSSIFIGLSITSLPLCLFSSFVMNPLFAYILETLIVIMALVSHICKWKCAL
jgi:membrane protein